jgi:hypothetical protein
MIRLSRCFYLINYESAQNERYIVFLNESTALGVLILKAIAKAHSLGMIAVPDVWVDSGTENLNMHVDELVASDLIRRTIAQIDVEASNSMVEMLFLRFKHRHMFTIPLTSFEAVESGADYYFTQSDTHIPMAVLKGATPEGVVTGKWTDQVIAGIQMLAVSGRSARIESNRSKRCTPCLSWQDPSDLRRSDNHHF